MPRAPRAADAAPASDAAGAVAPIGEPRSAKGRRTRARLGDAGKVVFARDGFLNARITDIAVEAGLSYGAFYHYFESKEELFREIAEQMELKLLAMDDLPEDKAHAYEPYERIRDANRSYLAAYREEAKLMAVIVEVSHYDEAVRKVRDQRQDEFAARLAASVTRLQQSKLADPDVDGAYAAMALGGMVARFADALFASGAKYDFEIAVEQLSILWANALGLPHPKPSAKPARRATAKRAAAKPAGGSSKRRERAG